MRVILVSVRKALKNLDKGENFWRDTKKNKKLREEIAMLHG